MYIHHGQFSNLKTLVFLACVTSLSIIFLMTINSLSKEDIQSVSNKDIRGYIRDNTFMLNVYSGN